MFPPSLRLPPSVAKLLRRTGRWASLPIVNRKVVGAILLTAFLFLISPLPILASHDLSPNQDPGDPTQRNGNYYQVVPLPSQNGSELVSPIPAPAEDYSIRQVNIFEDIGGGLKSLGGKIVGLVGDAANEAIGAALYLIENALVLQIAGKLVTDAISLIADGDLQGVERLLVDLKNNPNPAEAGLIGVAGNTTGTLLAMSLPISTGQYFASINPLKDIQAQDLGEGQKGLSGPDNIILELWTKVRNVSYILAVIVLIIAGFMIMLRMPLGPRTVVSAQNALPRIAVALLLITFSFAISGLLIDLTRMVASILNAMVEIPYDAIWTAIIGTIVAALMLGAVFGGVGTIVVLLFALLLAVITLIVLVIIIYKLLTRYVIFLLLTIFAPLFFIIGAIPGMEGLIFTWFKRAAAALLAIPITGLVLNLAFAIGFSGFGEVPVVSLNLLGGNLGQMFGWIALAPLIGFGLFFFATKVPDMVDELFNIRPAPRGGIGPGIVLAPVGMAGKGLSTLGTARRAAPTIAGWGAQLGARGGFVGGIGRRIQGVAMPFIDPQERGNFNVGSVTAGQAQANANQQQGARGAANTRGAVEPAAGPTRFTPQRGGEEGPPPPPPLPRADYGGRPRGGRAPRPGGGPGGAVGGGERRTPRREGEEG